MHACTIAGTAQNTRNMRSMSKGIEKTIRSALPISAASGMAR